MGKVNKRMKCICKGLNNDEKFNDIKARTVGIKHNQYISELYTCHLLEEK